MRLSPHLCFDGHCREAFAAYQKIFGGTIQTMMTYGESPMAAQADAGMRDLIVHASLEFEGVELSGVDIPLANYRKPQGFFITLTIDGFDRASGIFAALAEGGEIGLPFQQTFWSPGFGVVVDRFGTPWEINTGQPA